jgi:acyl-coenzyme A synthetase/AMP-(fatty) acid ligase
VSDEGLVSVSGRSGEMINAGGVKASPRDIESVVMQNPNIAEAAAFAMNNPATGVDEIWVAIVQKKPVSLEAIHRHCLDKLGQRAPRSILIAESLPRNERGKVLHEELVRFAAAAAMQAGRH